MYDMSGANFFKEGLIPVKFNYKYVYINKKGIGVTDFIYDMVGNFSDGFAFVCLNGKIGYIDKSGNEIIPLKYDSALPFNKGIARVMVKYKNGYIDKNGTEYWEEWDNENVLSETT